jgi:hypothetical protein
MGIVITYLYLLIGIISILLKKPLHRTYIVILVFMLFKFITNYRLCTVSYIECKVRGVKHKDGYLNQVLDPIIDLRETKHIFPILIISLIILYYDLIVLNNIKFVNVFLKNLKKKII